MNTIYRATAARIHQELAELDQVVARVSHIWERRQDLLPNDQDYLVDAVALNLHGFYAGVERLLELIADNIDQAKPQGAMWHRELLQQMTADIPTVRPAVLSTDTRLGLDRYRGFRHVVRNVYTFSLDAEQIELLVAHLPAVHNAVKADLEQFANFLEQLI